MTIAKQVSNTRVLVAQIPEGVAPNKSHFRTVTVNEAVPELKDGAIYIQNLVFSLDPCRFLNSLHALHCIDNPY